MRLIDIDLPRSVWDDPGTALYHIALATNGAGAGLDYIPLRDAALVWTVAAFVL